MKHLILVILLTFVPFLFSQTTTPPTDGDGTEDNPYQISTLDNLYWITATDSVWNKYFVQTSDIDAFDTANWFEGRGWLPIGNDSVRFSGLYNGQNFSISNLYINRPTEDYIGLFGKTYYVEINNINIVNSNVTGKNNIGILAGLIDGTAENCFSSGNVTGNDYVGGLLGTLGTISIINTCQSSVNVDGSNCVGGLTGLNFGIIYKCYSTGDVIGSITGEMYSGGLVGRNYNNITDCFSSSNVVGAIAGGITGFNDLSECESMIYRSFSYGQVTGNVCGGIVAVTNLENIFDSFWDTETSMIDSSAGGTGLTTSEMKTITTFTDAGWDFVDETTNGTNDIWNIDGATNNGYPFLSWQTTGIETFQATPSRISLEQNYPNPFNPETTISYSLMNNAQVNLKVFDIAGRKVCNLVDQKQNRGSHEVKFDASMLTSGIYFYRLSIDGQAVENRKMMLLK